jgi:hypothetical protein
LWAVAPLDTPGLLRKPFDGEKNRLIDLKPGAHNLTLSEKKKGGFSMF